MPHHEITGRNFTERRPHRLFTRDEFNYLVGRVCTYYRTEPETMHTRFKGNVTQDLGYRARQVLMYLAWMNYDTSAEEIAVYFNQNKAAARRAFEQVEDWRGAQLHLNACITRTEEDIIQRRINRAKHS